MISSRLRGFTLIELMITVVIIGILAGIAYPSFSSYMTQTRRSDAQAALTQAANRQEKFFTECTYYAQTLAGTRGCGANSAAGILGLGAAAPILSPDRHYVVTMIAPNAGCLITNCYVLQAAPATTAQGGTGRQSGDGNFQITSTGAKLWDRNNDGDYADSGETKWTK